MQNKIFKLIVISFFSVFFITNSYALNKITVMLDWFVNPDHGSLIVAKQKGFFKENDLNVEFIEPSNPNDPPRLLALGKVDFAVNYQPFLQLQAAEKLDNVRVATIIDNPLNSLVVLKNSNIKSIKDLKGKKIGFSVGAVEEVMVKVILEKVGLSLKDVSLINVNFNLTGALVSKNVDAVIGAYRNFELTQLEIKGFQGKAFYVEDIGIPLYDELVLVTTDKNKKSQNTINFIKSINQATKYIKNNPKKSWEIFKNYKKDVLDNELNKKAWDLTYKYFPDDSFKLNIKRYNDFAKFLTVNKLNDKDIPDLNVYAINPLK